jgi:ferritin
MMLSKKMESALNAQINAEFFASYQYLAMAAHFEAENLPGFANWMHVQSEEETTHAMKFYNFITRRRGRVTLTAIADPKIEWESPLAVFEASLEHEQKVTGMINNLMNLAIKEGDHATASFLKWFVDEQVEEEENVDNVIQDLKRVADSAEGLFILDRELGSRSEEGEGGEEADAT